MTKNRLEAFSDGVIAIIITIMVLELKVPHDASAAALVPLIPVALSYLLSFVYVGVYWNNHHHLLHTVRRVSGGVLWANMHLLFWLSLIPFASNWVGEHYLAPVPTALYGIVLLACAVAYFTLQTTIVRGEGPDSILRTAVGRDIKGKLSLGLYLVSVGIALWVPLVSQAIYALVALIWLIPDRRIERALNAGE